MATTEIISFLKEGGYPETKMYIGIVEDISKWWWWDESIWNSLIGFNNIVKREGVGNFFDNYTSAFDKWTEKQRSVALRISRNVSSRKKKENSLPITARRLMRCRWCKMRLDLNTEVQQVAKRYGMSPLTMGVDIKLGFSPDFENGRYVCGQCLD